MTSSLLSFLNNGNDGSRSSSSGHYSKDHDTITAGTKASDFYGIPLRNDLSYETLTFVAVLGIFVMVIKPRLSSSLLSLAGKSSSLSSTSTSVAFWMCILAVMYALKEVTLYPLLSNIVFTRTSYPYMVVIPHCIMAAASYRKERSATTTTQLHYLPAFAFGFFCYGFGGSIVSDVLMGLPATALGHARILPSYILGWLLVWFSPHDIVYRLLLPQKVKDDDKDSNHSIKTFHSPLYYFLSACEAVDAVTTPMGRVSRSARELNNKNTAPIVAGLLAGTGGAAVRYGERILVQQGDEQLAQSSFDALEAGVWKTLGYAVLWWYIAVYNCTAGTYAANDVEEVHHCHEFNGHNLHRVVIVLAHVAWNFASDLGMVQGHPFITAARYLRRFAAQFAFWLQCGPTSAAAAVEPKKKKN